MAGRRPWDDAGYRQRRKLLMASITPQTRCGRPGCGRLLSEHPPHKSGRPPSWHVGHVVDGDNRGPLRLEVSTCNQVAGGKLGWQRAYGNGHAGAAVARRRPPFRPGCTCIVDGLRYSMCDTCDTAIHGPGRAS